MANVDVSKGIVTAPDEPAIRTIGLSDLRQALHRGWDDFMETPTQLIFLGIIYPLIGIIAARAAAGGALLPLFYPLVAGLSLMGPVAAIGIYELSRRREAGEHVSWVNAIDVLRSPALGSIVGLGLFLCAIFVVWLLAAQLIYDSTMGNLPRAQSVGEFVQQVLGTSEGWRLIILGNAIGFLFAVVVLTLTVVSFPMLLDRNVSVGVAVRTSIRAVLANPMAMAAWGLIVAVLLLLGSLPAFVGLAVVMPLLGHATWHLYRRVVAN